MAVLWFSGPHKELLLEATAARARFISTSGNSLWGHRLHLQNFRSFYTSFTCFAFTFTIFSELCLWDGFLSFFWFPELPVNFWGPAFSALPNAGVGTA